MTHGKRINWQWIAVLAVLFILIFRAAAVQAALLSRYQERPAAYIENDDWTALDGHFQSSDWEHALDGYSVRIEGKTWMDLEEYASALEEKDQLSAEKYRQKEYARVLVVSLAIRKEGGDPDAHLSFLDMDIAGEDFLLHADPIGAGILNDYEEDISGAMLGSEGEMHLNVPYITVGWLDKPGRNLMKEKLYLEAANLPDRIWLRVQ